MVPSLARLFFRQNKLFSAGWPSFYFDDTNSNIDLTGTGSGTITSNPHVLVGSTGLYAIGGYDSGTGTATNKIQYADWSTGAGPDEATWADAGTLPANVCYGQLVTVGSTVYLIGGSSEADTSTLAPVTAIYSASWDGTALGAFSKVGDLPTGIAGFKAVVIQNKIYLIGGVDTNGLSTNIYVADIAGDNTVGTFTLYTNSLVSSWMETNALVVRNRIWVFGNKDIQSAPIDVSGNIGAFEVIRTIPVSADTTVYPVVTGGWLTLLRVSDTNGLITTNGYLGHYLYFPAWDPEQPQTKIPPNSFTPVERDSLVFNSYGMVELTGVVYSNQGRFTSIKARLPDNTLITRFTGDYSTIDSGTQYTDVPV